ncbi:lipoprotein-releasing ABC transporter permease subunit [Segnochrobactraceae bacterium EtOH-i3]
MSLLAKENATEPDRARPFAGYEWQLAGRYLRSRRRDAFISVIAGFSFVGIMLGVATLIIVMAVMNGFRSELTGKILGLNGHMIVQPIDGPLTDDEALIQRLAAVPGVTLVMPEVEGQALVTGPSGGFGAVVRGVRAGDITRLPLMEKAVKLGTLDGFDTGDGVAIGTRLARALGVSLGDTITLVSPKGAATPFGVTPKARAFPVTAIFEVGMSEFDGSVVFMPMVEAQDFFEQEGKITSIELFVTNPDRVGELREPIETAAERAIYVADWRQRNTTFFSALEVERNVMFLILTLIVLVAALNIVSGLTMLVKDKSRDIAILRTMGATRGTILRVFMITGSTIGVAGTFSGLLLGWVVCLNIESIRQAISWVTRTELFTPELYFLSQLPADMDSGETVSVVLMALALSFLATLYPAWKAARLDPVDALKSE